MVCFDSLDEQLAPGKFGAATFPPEVLETVAQNLDSTKYGSEESLTKVLDVARFTKVVDNEGNISTVAGECVMVCPQTGRGPCWPAGSSPGTYWGCAT